jgi:hypothetical protein
VYRIFSSVHLIVEDISNVLLIVYSSKASTLRVTLLHLVEDQCRILVLS